jgi:hypothetical protein
MVPATMTSPWRDHLPDRLGDLPLGGDLVRTDPAGPPDARVAIVGVHPAATAWKTHTLKGPKKETLVHVPTAVERTSFEPATPAGTILDKDYLAPLGLRRQDVLLLDLWPYYVASTRREGGRPSVADDVRVYEKVAKHSTAVQPRPVANELLARARTAPGSVERLRSILGSPSLRLVITLGNEPAAFARGLPHAADAQPFLYGEPAEVVVEVLGLTVPMVHMTHPGNGHPEWRAKHAAWCASHPQLGALGS